MIGLVLSIIMFIVLLFTIISHSRARSSAKSKIKEVTTQASEETKRPLTTEEHTALTHFGYNLGDSSEVIRFMGPIEKSSLTIDGNDADSYYTLGGILIQMTNQAERYIGESNYVEAATDGEQCIVLDLNEMYSLVERYREESAEQASLARLKRGEAGTIEHGGATVESTHVATEHQWLAAQSHYQSPFLYPAAKLWCLVAATFLAMNVMLNVVNVSWMTPLQSVQIGMVVIFYLLISRKLKTPSELPDVSRISGVLTQVKDEYLALGSLKLDYPAHWRKYFKKGNQVQLDVLADQGQIIGLTGSLDLADERSRFSSVYCHRYGVMFSLLILCTWLTYLWVDKPELHWHYLKMQMDNNARYQFDSGAELEQHNWLEGDRVEIQAPASCNWHEGDNICKHISFDPDLYPPKTMLAEHSAYEALLSLREEYFNFNFRPNKNYYAGFRKQPSHLKISSFPSMLKTLVSQCADIDYINCNSLYTAIRQTYNKSAPHNNDEFTPLVDNAALLSSATSEQKQKDIVIKGDPYNIYHKFSLALDKLGKQERQVILNEVKEKELPKLMFSIPSQDFFAKYSPNGSYYASHNYTWKENLNRAESPAEYYNALASKHDMVISGVVTKVSNLADAQVIELDTQYSFADQGERNATLMLLLLSILSLIFGLLWSWDLLKVNRAREERQRLLSTFDN